MYTNISTGFMQIEHANAGQQMYRVTQSGAKREGKFNRP